MTPPHAPARRAGRIGKAGQAGGGPSEEERHVGAGHLLARLHATPAIPARQAQDRLWLLMAPDHYHRLVVVRGWSRSAYEQWLTDGIRALFGT